MAQRRRPTNLKPDTDPPERGTYTVVVRRQDKRVWPWRVAVRYSGAPEIARGITFDGVTAPTLFLKNELERRVAYRMGWRDDITTAWFAKFEAEDRVEADRLEAHAAMVRKAHEDERIRQEEKAEAAKARALRAVELAFEREAKAKAEAAEKEKKANSAAAAKKKSAAAKKATTKKKTTKKKTTAKKG